MIFILQQSWKLLFFIWKWTSHCMCNEWQMTSCQKGVFAIFRHGVVGICAASSTFDSTSVTLQTSSARTETIANGRNSSNGQQLCRCSEQLLGLKWKKLQCWQFLHRLPTTKPVVPQCCFNPPGLKISDENPVLGFSRSCKREKHGLLEWEKDTVHRRTARFEIMLVMHGRPSSILSAIATTACCYGFTCHS